MTISLRTKKANNATATSKVVEFSIRQPHNLKWLLFFVAVAFVLLSLRYAHFSLYVHSGYYHYASSSVSMDLPTILINLPNNTSSTNQTTHIQQQEDHQANATVTATNPKEEPTDHGQKKVVYYAKARKDRLGSVALDMLRAHAYSFMKGYKYGGAVVGWPHDCKKRRRMEEIEPIFKALELDRAIPYDYPDKSVSKSNWTILGEVHSEYAKPKIQTSQLFTPEWKKHFFSQWNSSSLKQDIARQEKADQADETVVVAVHIRRGDVEPCTYGDRYLPNSSYLWLLDEYVHNSPKYQNKKVKINIYSQSDSYEPFDDFVQRNYTLHLDTEIVDVLTGLLTADIVIVSTSSFSVFPAIINSEATIIHPFSNPRLFPPLYDWILPDDLFHKHNGVQMGIQRSNCTEYKKEKHVHDKGIHQC